WVGCITYFEMARQLSHAALRSVWLGGLFYSIGAVLNVLHWPNLVPGVFGAHEVFHLFVMAGSLCHYYFMLAVVVPYRRPAVVHVAVEAQAPLSFRGTLARQAAEG